MRAVIIGATGHVGTYLVPKLVDNGYEVISITRQLHKPYHKNDAWTKVKQVYMDRVKAESNGSFGKAIAELDADVVIDMICFNVDSAQQLVEALEGKISHYLQCGTIWVHGHSIEVPVEESMPRNPFCEYGINKAAVEKYLLDKSKNSGFPATILHPGHIVGPGWRPINPTGNLNMAVFDEIARGEVIQMPNHGMETLHHVHAADVAAAFIQALRNKDRSVGESFHITSPKATTMRGYAERVAEWFGKKAVLEFLCWKEWKMQVSEEDAAITLDHLLHSPNCSIAKAQALLDYRPAYTSLEAVKESINNYFK